MAFNSSLIVLKSTAVNLNATGDAVTFSGLPTDLEIIQMSIGNWSGTPAALLALTLRDAASAGGNSLVGAVAALNTPITATSLIARALPLATVLGAVQRVTTGTLVVNVSAANGSALTADIHVFALRR